MPRVPRRVFPDMRMLTVALIRRDQRTVVGQPLGFFEDTSPVSRVTGDLPGSTALGPAAREDQCITPVRPHGLDLHCFESSKHEAPLEIKTDANIGISDMPRDCDGQEDGLLPRTAAPLHGKVSTVNQILVRTYFSFAEDMSIRYHALILRSHLTD